MQPATPMNPQMPGGWPRGCETPSAPSGLVPLRGGTVHCVGHYPAFQRNAAILLFKHGSLHGFQKILAFQIEDILTWQSKIY